MKNYFTFYYKGYDCTVTETEKGYFGSAVNLQNPEDSFHHEFPSNGSYEEVKELMMSIDTRNNIGV